MTTQVDRPLGNQPVRTTGQQAVVFARRYSLQIGIVVVLLLMWIFLMVAAPKTFLTHDIYSALFASVPFYGIMALPITLLVIAKEIDLSFGSIMALSMVAFFGTFQATGSAVLAFLACLVTGFLAGLLNGIIVVKIGIPSMVATIGTQFLWRGVVVVATGAKSLSVSPVDDVAPWMHDLLVGRLFPRSTFELPVQMIWMVVVAVAIWALLNRHRFGAHVYLIGDNDNSAKLMGVNVDMTRMMLFAIVGLSAALAGLLASYEVSNFFSSLGDGYLLQTLAAVFLGGTSVLGGTGTILGTFVGCFIIGVIQPGTVAVGLTGFWTQLIYGLIIVVSVAMHTILRRRIS